MEYHTVSQSGVDARTDGRQTFSSPVGDARCLIADFAQMDLAMLGRHWRWAEPRPKSRIDEYLARGQSRGCFECALKRVRGGGGLYTLRGVRLLPCRWLVSRSTY